MKEAITMMLKQTAQIIELIQEGKTCNQICEAMNLTNRQLYLRLMNLENKGLFFRRKYYSGGNILYRQINKIPVLKEYKKVPSGEIITRPDETEIKVIVISDTHFGSKLERIDLLDRVYNYCINNNIHIIFNCGDIIDGTFGHNDKRIKDVYSQIDYLIKKYPFDKNILTFAVGGDHDHSALTRGYQDIIEIIKNYRHDLIFQNYYNATISIKNEKILLHHREPQGKLLADGRTIDGKEIIPIVLNGHLHKYVVEQTKSDGVVNVLVPSLSDLNESFPTALELTLTFAKGYISNATFRQIYFGVKDTIISEVNYDLSNHQIIPRSTIMFEESYSFDVKEECDIEETSQRIAKQETKPIVKKLERPSQIDRFNQRYNLE